MRLMVRGERKEGERTHDEVARVSEEQLADLEALRSKVRVETGGELVVTRGPQCCGPSWK